MPKREIKVYLEDIIATGKEVQLLHKDVETITTFLSKNYYYRTAERCFQIIGEALYQANKLNPTLNITNKSQIIGLRHILSHDYEIIDNARLWIYMEKYLSTLISEAEHLLTEELKKENN